MIIIKEIEQIVPLKLGFIGYNLRLTQDGLIKFAENNKEDIAICNHRQNYIRLKDGTEIFGLYENGVGDLKSRRLDQLILFDDNRWEIKWKRFEFIQRIIERYINVYSCVPEEFQILEYEDVG